METILILLITIAVANCGLLKELIQPVTDSVHKGELFNQKEQKENSTETKGILDKLVNNLDTGAEKIVDVLTGGFKPEAVDAFNKNLNDTEDTKKPDVPKPANDTNIEDLTKQPSEFDVKDITTPTINKDSKIDDVTTPKVEVKEEVTKKVEDVKVEEPKA